MNIDVIKARYLDNYKLEITFSDMKINQIDFEKFLNKFHHPTTDKYKKISNFKKFKIDGGNLVWGNNWDIIFPVYKLYKGKI